MYMAPKIQNAMRWSPPHVCQQLYTSNTSSFASYKWAIHGQLTCRIRATQVHSRPTHDLFTTYQLDWRSIRAARELVVHKKSSSRGPAVGAARIKIPAPIAIGSCSCIALKGLEWNATPIAPDHVPPLISTLRWCNERLTTVQTI